MAELTDAAVRYLFAADWLPADSSNWAVHVPGGVKVGGPQLAAALLNLALWSLRERGLVELEQLRPVERERVMILGGKPFARVSGCDRTTETHGLEGMLLAAARGAAVADEESDQRGVRRLVLALDLPYQSPWSKPVGCCWGEALRAGLLEQKGFFIKKPVIVDPDGIEALRPRNDAIAAARDEHRQRQPELDDAVYNDCLAALRAAHGEAG